MSLSVSDLYSGLGSSSISADALSQTASMNQLTNQINGAETDQEMLAACEEFEVYLLQKMFQSMEESAKVFSDEEEEGNEYVDMFSDNMYQAMAENMVSSGQEVGIAQTLYESMTRNGAGVSAISTTDSAE